MEDRTTETGMTFLHGMDPDPHKWTGWRIGLCEYAFEVVSALPEEASLFITRAYYRAYGLESYDELYNVGFMWVPSPTGPTGILNMEEGEARQRVDDVILGVVSALEVIYESRDEPANGDVKA